MEYDDDDDDKDDEDGDSDDVGFVRCFMMTLGIPDSHMFC